MDVTKSIKLFLDPKTGELRLYRGTQEGNMLEYHPMPKGTDNELWQFIAKCVSDDMINLGGAVSLHAQPEVKND